MPLFDDQKEMLFIHRFPTHFMVWHLTESKNDNDWEYENRYIESGAAFRDLEDTVWFISALIWFTEKYVTDEIEHSKYYYDSTVIDLTEKD